MKLKSYIFCYHKEKGRFWFRLFTIGLFFKNVRMHDRIFSERYGAVNYIIFRGWLIRPLFK